MSAATCLAFGFIDFNLIADLYGNSTERSWKRVDPWIEKERARRNNATYAPCFEKFAKRCLEYNAQKHGEELQTFRRAIKPQRSKRSSAGHPQALAAFPRRPKWSAPEVPRGLSGGCQCGRLMVVFVLVV
jgi:hypothetical protein